MTVVVLFYDVGLHRLVGKSEMLVGENGSLRVRV